MSDQYLWINMSDQTNQTKYVYLDEYNNEIIGNTVYQSSIDSPYTVESIHKVSICVGKACVYVRTIHPNRYQLNLI
jgi:hypothetical protein